MRGKALAVFTVAPFAGPALGPTVAGFIGTSVSWRWLFWVLAIFVSLLWIFSVKADVWLTKPFLGLNMRACDNFHGTRNIRVSSHLIGVEHKSSLMYLSPVLFVKKAQAKRLETGDNRYWAKLERQDVTFKQRAKKVLSQPFIVLFTEPMLLALTLYMSVSTVENHSRSPFPDVSPLVCLRMPIYPLHSISNCFHTRPRLQSRDLRTHVCANPNWWRPCCDSGMQYLLVFYLRILIRFSSTSTTITLGTSGKFPSALRSLYPPSCVWKYLPGLVRYSQFLSFGLRACHIVITQMFLFHWIRRLKMDIISSFVLLGAYVIWPADGIFNPIDFR